MRNYFLKRIDGGQEHQIFKLPSDAKEVTIGRLPSSTHVIPSPEISRNHATLKVQLDEWFIRDNGSMNGISVNKNCLTPQTWYHIKVGDLIYFTPWDSNDSVQKFVYEMCVDNEKSRNELLSKVKEMEKLLAQKDQVQKELEAKLEQKDAEIHLKLEVNRKLLKANYESELELELDRKEEALMYAFKLKDQVCYQREILQQRTRRIERDMQDIQNELRLDYDKRLSDHNKELQAKLEKEKSKLIIELKEANSKMSVLKRQIEHAKNNDRCSETAAIIERQKVIKNIADVMDTELQCSICNELFIKAVTLNCSHSFCQYCISAWEKTNKICPICRASITIKTNSIVLDSFIEKMCENISDELKAKRKNLVAERAAEMEAAKKNVRKPPKKRQRRSAGTANLLDAPSTSGTSRRARRRNRSAIANEVDIPLNRLLSANMQQHAPFSMNSIPNFNLFQTPASCLGISNSTAAAAAATTTTTTTTATGSPTSDVQSSSVMYISSDSDSSPNPRRRNLNRRNHSRSVIVVSDTEDCG